MQVQQAVYLGLLLGTNHSVLGAVALSPIAGRGIMLVWSYQSDLLKAKSRGRHPSVCLLFSLLLLFTM